MCIFIDEKPVCDCRIMKRFKHKIIFNNNIFPILIHVGKYYSIEKTDSAFSAARLNKENNKYRHILCSECLFCLCIYLYKKPRKITLWCEKKDKLLVKMLKLKATLKQEVKRQIESMNKVILYRRFYAMIIIKEISLDSPN